MMIRPSTILSIIAVSAVGYGMFQVKYEVMQLEERLNRVNHRIAERREAIHVLNAEWSLLSQPTRLDELARRYLNLAPITNAQLGHLDTLPLRPGVLPDVPPAQSGPTPASPQFPGAMIATVKVSAER